MQRLLQRRFVRHAKTWLVAFSAIGLTLVQAGTALAAKAKEEEVASGPSYAMSWAIVVLFLVLGLMVTLRPINRNTDFRREEEDKE